MSQKRPDFLIVSTAAAAVVAGITATSFQVESLAPELSAGHVGSLVTLSLSLLGLLGLLGLLWLTPPLSAIARKWPGDAQRVRTVLRLCVLFAVGSVFFAFLAQRDWVSRADPSGSGDSTDWSFALAVAGPASALLLLASQIQAGCVSARPHLESGTPERACGAIDARGISDWKAEDLARTPSNDDYQDQGCSLVGGGGFEV